MTIKPVINLIQRQAALTPDNTAIVYDGRSYTYRDVMAQACGITQQIREAGLAKDDVVGILIPRNQWLAMAPVGVLAAGCAYMPLDPAYPAERLSFMLSDSHAKLLIADRDVLCNSGLTMNDGLVVIEDEHIPVLLTDTLTPINEASALNEEPSSADALALLIYTSGSTGQPKGCMIEQGNISCLVEEAEQTMVLDGNSRVASYASFSFVPTVQDIFGTLSTGGTLYIIPEDVRFDFVRLAQFINDNAITHIIMSTMTGAQFVTTDDCPSLRCLSVGGEKLNPVTPPSGLTFLNVYGSSECCGMITCHAVKGDEANVPIGKAPGTYRLYIVDEDGQPVADGEAGELWVSGPQLCRGYLNHPELTATVFIDNPFNDAHEEGYERVFRTGDFVRRDAEGRLLFAGRRDGLVKIRGFRVELREVEAAVLTCPGVTGATLQSASDPLNGTYIVAYVTGEGRLDDKAIKQHVADLKPAYMVPEVVMQLDKIPRNNNGKVDRERLPKPKRGTSIAKREEGRGKREEFVAENDLQRELHEIVADVIGTDDFGLNTPLSLAGMTSVSAIKVCSLLYKKYGVNVDARKLVASGDIRMLEQAVGGTSLVNSEERIVNQRSTAEGEVDSDFSFPLTSAQTGVFVDQAAAPDTTLYNLPGLISFSTDIATDAIKEAVVKVVGKHPLMNAVVQMDGSETRLTIRPFTPQIEVIKLAEADVAQHAWGFIRPFSLYEGPLYRFEILVTPVTHYLLMDIHHLIFDGSSFEIFLSQLCRVLDGLPIEDEGKTYAEYALQQGDPEAGADYFAKLLKDFDHSTLIPSDCPAEDTEGCVSTIRRPIDMEHLTAFCRQQGVTPASVTLAAVAYTLARFSGERCAALCTVSSGRAYPGISDTTGMFVNTLPLYVALDGQGTVENYLWKVNDMLNATMCHEDYPFAKIAADYGFNPQTAFVYQIGVIGVHKAGGHEVTWKRLSVDKPKFRLEVLVEDDGWHVDYDNSYYTPQLMQDFAQSLSAVLERFISAVGSDVLKVSVVDDEQEQCLAKIRQTATGEAPFKFFHACISHFAQEQPGQEALVACDATYTYKEMDELTNRIANGLLQRGVKSGDRVALLLPRTSRLILSMFGVLKAGAAYIPCDPDYPENRVKLILEDSEAKLTITPELAEELLRSACCDAIATNITGDDLAYLIYTSGSTGRPKGVMLRHEGICNYLYGHPANVFANAVQTDASRILSVTTISFDAALQDIGMAYYNGKTLILATEEQANNPLELAQLIREQHIDMVSGTPSRWQTWLTSDDFCQAIGGVRICRAGGEKYPQQLLDQLRSITKARLFNCYGPTEITVASNNAELTHASLITVGKPQLNVKEYIVDGDGNELPVGVVGELYIGGKGVARGYNNLDEMTRERFVDYHGERIYKSGDYAKWLPDGNVVVLGRTDHQIKLRGLRIELGEVESAILHVDGVKQVVVTIRQIGGMEHLCAYFTADREIDTTAMRTAISSHLTDYMVPTAYMQLDHMPMTPNGKTDIKALPDPQVQMVQGGSGTASSRRLTRIEKELQGMVTEILGVENVDVECPLSMVGLTSLSAIRLAILIQQCYGVTLQAKKLVKNCTLMSIEDEILTAMLSGRADNATSPSSTSSLSSSPSSSPLSYAQTGVYFDCLKNPTAIQYNIPHMVTFPKDVNPNALAEAVRTLVGKHPQMTARFEQTAEGIVQTVNPEMTIDIAVKTMSEDELQQYKHDFVRPFDLATAPLCRFEIVTTQQAVCLLFDVHHLVFDGASTDIFFRQLCRLLDGSPVEDDALSYPAYVMDEKAAEDGEDYQKARDFFNERLSVVEAATEVRPDLPNPVTGTVNEAISALDIKTIEAFCRTHQITPAHLTLAAVYYALSRFANSEQVCITTVSSGRSDLRIRSTVGMFVNTLAMTATIGKQSVSDFLQEVSTNFDETLSHENYPFAQIAADYGLAPEIQFVCQLGMDSQYTVGGTPLKMEILGTHTPKFPITFFIAPANGIPSVCVAYDNGKYSARLMQSLAEAVKVTVERMIAKPDAALTSISIVSDEEAQRIIKIGTGKEIDVDLSKTFANLFTEQAKRTPDAPAVVDRDSQLTYGEMDRYSNALARQLIDFGVQPNDFVCVMLDRFKEFPLAVLAIHKAGAAYTPLDFEYPNERLSYMLENSESKVLITSHDVLEAKQAEGDFSTAAAKTFVIDDFMTTVVGDSVADAIDLSSPDGLAYMIYTSGSTGKPKGAMLHQAGLRNFIAVVIDMEQLTGEDRISGHRSFSFDAHIEDMYPVLTLGGSFHIMPTEIRKDLTLIRQFLFDHQITGGGYSTAMTSLLLNTFDDLPIRFTTGGGEKLDGVYSDHIEIINVYGPTECTDDTSYYSIAPGRRVENIPIGQSVANNWNFIVDTAGHLVPQGVAGELCFAGVQVGRGYWRLPERTAKSFVDCPFVKQDRWGRPVRMYHTGDLCRWNEDGQIEYMGRIDTQVKLRGFRIELGEIESKALNIDGIRQAAAEVRKVMGNEHLVLYYTVVDGFAIGEDDIRKTLAASSLADYMVPDAYMQMDSMPMTPNGKINRKALPAPEMKRATEYEPPKGENEELFCSIFSEILKIKEVGATDNFFEIGGTSINAIKVIVEASKHGVQIVFNDLFNQKTPRALAAFVDASQTSQTSDTSPTSLTSQARQAGPQADSPEAAQFAPLNALLCTNTLDSFREGKRQTIGDVLLTGVTGYLGIHILHELLSNYHGKILCPVRAKGNDEAMSRIKTLYFYYFGRTEAFSHFDERVTAFGAEVTQPDGLDSITQQGLTVVNCVANVKHFSAGNDIEMVNIESVRHLIGFCLRTGSRLIHISTNSIAGLSVDNVPGPEVKLTEQSFYIGQNVSERKYTYSKFKAEELVLDAIAHHGLNAKIMRVGNLSARQKDGEFQINFNTNNFLALLRAFVVIGMVPYEKLNVRFEFSPIDEVARAIMLLAQSPEDCIVFHPYNIHQQFLSDVLNGFAQAGIPLKHVESEEFSQRLNTMMDNPDLVTLLRPLMAYNLGSNRNIRNIECTNDYTTQVLYRLGFQWPPTAADYVHRFVDTITGYDYFTV